MEQWNSKTLERASSGVDSRSREVDAMNEPQRGQRQIEHALARAQVYRLLAHAFFQPDSPLNEIRRNGRLLSEGRAALAALPATRSLLRLLGSVEEGFRATSRRELSRRYVALISHGGEGASLPYETEYTSPHAFQKQAQLADIAGFYRAFGLQWETQGHERPDHLSLELEFMYYLALKQAHALAHGAEDGVAVCVDAQEAFLRDHLGRWPEAFRRALATRAPDALYARLAHVIESWVAWDCRRQGVKPSLVAVATVSPEPPEVGGCPYSDAGCPAAPTGGG